MIEALLSTLRETEVQDAIPSLVQVFENVTGSLVMVTQAENGRSKLLLLRNPWQKRRFCPRGYLANTTRNLSMFFRLPSLQRCC